MSYKDAEMFYDASPVIFDRARKLRARLTKEEELLWEHLKLKPNGIKWRRQHPIATYIVDFYCHKFRLVIELDGKIHLKKSVKENDQIRQIELEKLGLKVIRFKNDEILNKISTVYKCIEEEIKKREDTL